MARELLGNLNWNEEKHFFEPSEELKGSYLAEFANMAEKATRGYISADAMNECLTGLRAVQAARLLDWLTRKKYLGSAGDGSTKILPLRRGIKK